jgi:hypothetical protein
MLKVNFPQNVKLEIKVKDKYYKTSSNVFRSWHGPRRADGKPFTGEVYCFNSNDIYRQYAPKAPTVKVKKITFKKLEPLAIKIVTPSSKGAGYLPVTKSGRPLRMAK